MLRNESGGGGTLPPEYQQVEWIGYQGLFNFLVLPVKWDSDEIHAKIAKLSVPSGRSVFPSAFNLDKTLALNPWGSIETSGSRNTSVSPVVSISDTFDFTNFVITFSEIASNDQNFYLGFGYNGDAFCPKLRFQEIEVYKNSDLVFKAIMCYRKADGKIGIYDTVSNEFYESSGTWEKGADV